MNFKSWTSFLNIAVDLPTGLCGKGTGCLPRVVSVPRVAANGRGGSYGALSTSSEREREGEGERDSEKLNEHQQQEKQRNS